MSEDTPIEKPINKETEQFTKEILELQEKIKEENPNINELSLFIKKMNIMRNHIKELMDYAKTINLFGNIGTINVDQISTSPGEIKSEKTTKKTIKATSKKDKEEDYILENVKMKFETDKAYLLQDENDQVAWIPKKCMKSLDTIKNIAVIHGWFKEKVQFEEEEPFEP